MYCLLIKKLIKNEKKYSDVFIRENICIYLISMNLNTDRDNKSHLRK